MSLYTIDYWGKSSGMREREFTFVIDDSEIDGIINNIYKEYEGQLIGRGRQGYLINGGLVIPGRKWVRIIHESQEGLEALAQNLGLPTPVTSHQSSQP